MGAPAHGHPPTDPQHDYELRAPICVLPSHSPLKTSPASRRVAHVLKLQRRMTAGPREALARAAPAPDLYNPQARASVGADDLVIDAVGTLRGGHSTTTGRGLTSASAADNNVEPFMICDMCCRKGQVALRAPEARRRQAR